MGIENRSYYREESNYGFGSSLGNGWSMITWIIVICVAVFVLDMFFNVGDALALRSDRPYFIWTWLTYGFTHAHIDSSIGYWHILGNMLTLFFLGRSVEMRMGEKEFLYFYLAAIVVSGLGALLLNLTSQNGMSLVGASGAVTAVVTVFILWFPKQTLLIWGVLPVPAWALGVFMIYTNLQYAFTPNSQVSWEAHAMGLAFGLGYLKSGVRLAALGGDPLSSRLFSGRPKLRLHDPEAADNRLKAEGDRILEKINQSGEQSLTGRERKTLNKYSQSLRKRRN